MLLIHKDVLLSSIHDTDHTPAIQITPTRLFIQSKKKNSLLLSFNFQSYYLPVKIDKHFVHNKIILVQ